MTCPRSGPPAARSCGLTSKPALDRAGGRIGSHLLAFAWMLNPASGRPVPGITGPLRSVGETLDMIHSGDKTSRH